MKIHLTKPAKIITAAAAFTAMCICGYLFEKSDDTPFIEHIPTSVPAHTAQATAPPSKDGAININTADKEELMQLENIGEVLAERIIQYRSEHGSFKMIEDIMLVSGIGEKTFEAIRSDICVD
ncbi:MAG: helix-hairpin-helix domain-containing protein [Clostridiales bacterium]|nr:helix-hairpin-helix domain-containing protein [Clostridiales bacterium]